MHPGVRRLVREVTLDADDLIAPLFVREGLKGKSAISAMPGQFQLGLDSLSQEIAELEDCGIRSVILFGIPENKDPTGSSACHDQGIVQQAIVHIKTHHPDVLVVADLCFCEYTDHGHCGVWDEQKQLLDNDATLPLLAQQAISLAQAGADIIAPSGMLDGMVKSVRTGLDEAGLMHVPILSYSVKYASSFYGPFREAAEGAPQLGNRENHQMQIANGNEALREVALDLEEGADMIMVKPAGPYLDVIQRLAQTHPGVPLVGYQVSGEYASLMAGIENGWLDESVIMESLIAIKRAGAGIIISYFAKRVGQLLGKNSRGT